MGQIRSRRSRSRGSVPVKEDDKDGSLSDKRDGPEIMCSSITKSSLFHVLGFFSGTCGDMRRGWPQCRDQRMQVETSPPSSSVCGAAGTTRDRALHLLRRSNLTAARLDLSNSNGLIVATCMSTQFKLHQITHYRLATLIENGPEVALNKLQKSRR